ncbi:MAG TPA: PGPGW domain-containing protein [Candidatus Kapabacteria bacterium]
MTDNSLVNKTVGWTFILLGVAGFILPILQGLLFFIVGLLFLSKEYHWAFRLQMWLRGFLNRSSPKLGKIFDDAEKFIEKEVYKLTHEKGYFWKRSWVIVLILAFLGLIGWLMSMFFFWLKDLIWG